MSFVTLFTDERSWLATDKRVYSAEEQTTLESIIETMQHLSDLRNLQIEEFQNRVAEAEELGFDQGYAKGQAAAQKQSVETLVDLQQRFQQAQLASQNAIVELSMTAVRRIAGNVAPDAWLAAQAHQAAAELAPHESPLLVRVSPVNAEQVKLRLREQFNPKDKSAQHQLDVVADEQVHESGCTLETPFGTIDVDLDTQLEVLCTVLNGGSNVNSSEQPGSVIP